MELYYQAVYYVMTAVSGTRRFIKKYYLGVILSTLLIAAYSMKLGFVESFISFGSLKIARAPAGSSHAIIPGARAYFDYGSNPCDESVRHLFGIWPMAKKTSNAASILKDNSEVACIEGSSGSMTIELPKAIVLKKLTLQNHPKGKGTTPKEVVVYGSADNSEYRTLMTLKFPSDRLRHEFYYNGNDHGPVKYIRLSILSNYGSSKITIQRVGISGTEVP